MLMRMISRSCVRRTSLATEQESSRMPPKRDLMLLCAVPSLFWSTIRRLVQAHGFTDQRPKRILVDRFSFLNVDCAPGVAIEARVEKA